MYLLLQASYSDANSSYRVIVETFNKQLPLRERVGHVEVSVASALAYSICFELVDNSRFTVHPEITAHTENCYRV